MRVTMAVAALLATAGGAAAESRRDHKEYNFHYDARYPGELRSDVGLDKEWKGKDILFFSNIESPGGRHHGTVWASFDGARTWPLKRLVTEGAFAYSSLTAGLPGTPGEGSIYLLFEGQGGGHIARFNLSWLLGGEKTGDGDVPAWITESGDKR